ncbi:hypothetical protein [Streptomyces wedmorensis]
MPDTHPNPPRTAHRETTKVALYACEPDPDVVRGMLAAAATVAAGHGWTIVDEGTISDGCLLTQAPQSRPGWDRVRALAQQSRINLVVVPARGHIGFTQAVWEAEQRFLRRHGVCVASVEPLLDAVLTGALV